MLKNITELLVEQKLDSLWDKQTCCKCQKCREDILAYALNKLPVQYVSSDVGEIYVRAESLSTVSDFNIIKELAFAIKVVSENPHH